VVEVGLQDVELLVARHGTQAEAPAARASLENDVARGLGVAHPLRASPRGDEESLASELEDVDGRRIDAAGPAAVHLQQVVVARSQAEADEHAEELVEEALDAAGLAKLGDRAAHRGGRPKTPASSS